MTCVAEQFCKETDLPVWGKNDSNKWPFNAGQNSLFFGILQVVKSFNFVCHITCRCNLKEILNRIDEAAFIVVF